MKLTACLSSLNYSLRMNILSVSKVFRIFKVTPSVGESQGRSQAVGHRKFGERL